MSAGPLLRREQQGFHHVRRTGTRTCNSSQAVHASHISLMSALLNLKVLRTIAELVSILPEWNAIWLEHPDARPFQRSEWLLPWWRHFGQEHMYVVCIRRENRLVGLLPAYVYVDPKSRERQLLLIGAGTSDYLDGIFTPACTPQDVAEALSLVAEETTWDVAYFTQLLPDSSLYKALEQGGAEGFAGESCSSCQALSIADLPKKVRADVRYFRNAAISCGELRMLVADADLAPSAFEDLVRLHSARWQEAQQAGVLADPDVLSWHREAIPLLQAADCLRLYTLTLDQDPVAVLYALIDPPERVRRSAYLYLIGYSPAHASFQPGTLLTAMASEHASSEGVQVLDMLRGNEAYKSFWKVQVTPTFGFKMRREDLLRT